MNLVQCPKSHYYDASLYNSCPTCAKEGGLNFNSDIGPTAPVMGADVEIGATEPVDGNPGATMAVDSGFAPGDFGAMNMDMNGTQGYDDPTMPVSPTGEAGFTPVVGWLVCIDGPARGTDYRVRAGYNYIGRSEAMDICIVGDNRIGRDRHAMIAYDDKERVFFFGPADGRSIVRMNGKMVMVPTEINAYNVVSIGSTKLLFVPLCGESFDWNE